MAKKELKRPRVSGMTVKVNYNGKLEDRYIPLDNVESIKFEYDSKGSVEKIKLVVDAANRKEVEEAVEAAHEGKAIVTAWPPKSF